MSLPRASQLARFSRRLLAWPPICLAASLVCLPLAAGAQSDLVFDDFEDQDLVSAAGWTWEFFAKGGREVDSITVSVRGDGHGGSFLLASGALPDDGTGFSYGGFFCSDAQRDARPVKPIDFSAFYGLAFRAASDAPGYYAIRLEQEETSHNSTNVAFPLTQEMQDFLIPLSEFKTGTERTTALAVTPLVDEPGAPFYVKFDDVRFVATVPADARTAGLESRTDWAPSPKIGWQNAYFQNKPLLLYFSSDFAVPCRLFENRLLESSEFPSLAREFVLARVDVNRHQSLVRECNVWKVPTFVAFDCVSGESTVLYSGSLTAELMVEMRDYLARRPEATHNASATAPARLYKTVQIDDFSDRNDLNDVGGRWGTYAAGGKDRDAINWRFMDSGGGNMALEARGLYPGQPGGVSYGGLYTQLSPDGKTTRDLSAFGWISFICRSSSSTVFQLHIENTRQQPSHPQPFHVSSEMTRVTLPLSAFGAAAKEAGILVWTEPDPKAGAEFHFVIDDVMVIR